MPVFQSTVTVVPSVYPCLFHFAIFSSPSPPSAGFVSQSMRSYSLEIENIESGVNILIFLILLSCYFSVYTFFWTRRVTVKPSFIHPLACLEVQAALYRIAGYSGDHSRGEGFQTRPVASQEASGRSLEPSACWLLPESLEDPAEGRKESQHFFLF